MSLREGTQIKVTPHRRTFLIGARLFFALLTLAALASSFVDALKGGRVVNYFSFFTILSNTFAAVVLIVGAIYLIRRRQPNEVDDIIRGSAAVAMVIVGLVFGLLLSHMANANVVPWVNFVTHTLMPVVMALDWLFQPPRSKLVLRHIGYWLIYPLAYLIYSLIRGALVGWYPYWFLDPNKAPGGWSGVALYAGAIALGFLVVSSLLLILGNRLTRNVVY